MQSAFLSGASASPPTMPVAPSLGFPAPGNPGVSLATKPGAWWYHMVTQELLAVVAAAGLTPDQANLSQLLQALPSALASRPEMSRSLTGNGYQKLPGGLILQWGYTSIAASTVVVVNFPIAFPVACFAAYASGYDAVLNGTNYRWNCGLPGLTQMNIANNWTGPINGSWLAIGK